MAAPEHLEDFGIEAHGVDEVDVVPWSTLFRRRLLRRGAGTDGVSEELGDAAVAVRTNAQRTAILLTVLLGNFATGITFTILAGSLPRIAKELGTTDSLLVWVLTGPLLASAIFGPMFGRAGDIWGHRRVYLFGMAGTAVFALGGAIAWNGWSLIAFRVLGASFGAALGPSSLALIFRVYDAESRVKAMGWWSFVGAGAPVLGVAVGGPIVEAGHWRWLFGVQVPALLIALAVARRILPADQTGEAHRRFDWAGAFALGAMTASLLLGLNRGPAWGWRHGLVLGCFALAPVALAAFVSIERRTPHPMLPLRFLRRRNFSMPILTQGLLSVAYMGGFFAVPRLLQETALFGYSVTKANAMTIARPLLFSLTAPLAGWVASRRGERRAGLLGAALVGASMIGLALIEPGMSDALIFLAVGLSGVGFGISAPAMSSSVANSVDEDDLGIAGATHQLAGQFGNVAGIQLMATITAALRGDGSAASVGHSYRVAFVVGVVACGLASFAAVRVRNHPRVEP